MLNIGSENYFKYNEESNLKISTILETSKYGNKYYMAIPFVLSNTYKNYKHEDFYYGINFKYKYVLREDMLFSKNIELYKKENYISKYKGEVLAVDMYLDTLKQGNNYLRLGIKYSDEFYDLKYFSSTMIGAKVEYSKEIYKDMIFKIGYISDIFRNYKEIEEGFDKKREDKQSEVKLLLTKDFKEKKYTLNINLSYLKNNSNFEIYEYDNFKTEFSLIKSF